MVPQKCASPAQKKYVDERTPASLRGGGGAQAAPGAPSPMNFDLISIIQPVVHPASPPRRRARAGRAGLAAQSADWAGPPLLFFPPAASAAGALQPSAKGAAAAPLRGRAAGRGGRAVRPPTRVDTGC